jgi:hypothetical protein
LFGAKFKEEELFELIFSFGVMASQQKWYFCHEKYPPDGDFKSLKESWPKLKGHPRQHPTTGIPLFVTDP